MSIVAEETNAGLTVFVAEITSMCGLRCDGIVAGLVNSLDYLPLSLDLSFHGTHPLCAVSCNALPRHNFLFFYFIY